MLKASLKPAKLKLKLTINCIPQMKDVTTIGCVTKCCLSDTCDVALYSLRKCYHIQCRTDLSDACTPVLSQSPRHNDTVMVVTRSKYSLESEMVDLDPNYTRIPLLTVLFLFLGASILSVNNL